VSPYSAGQILVLLLSFNEYGADPEALEARAEVLARQQRDRVPLMLAISHVEARHDPEAAGPYAAGFYGLRDGVYGLPGRGELRRNPWAELLGALWRLEESRRLCGAAALDYYNGGGWKCWTRPTATCEGPRCRSYGRKVKRRERLYRRLLDEGPARTFECVDEEGRTWTLALWDGIDAEQVYRSAQAARLQCGPRG